MRTMPGMSWRNMLRRGRAPEAPPVEHRRRNFAIDRTMIDPALFGLESWETTYTSIAVPVSREEALQVPAVLRARNVIAGTLGTLPLEVHDKSRAEVPSAFLAQIDSRRARSVTLAYTVEDLLFYGEAWWRIRAFSWDGFPAEAERVDPLCVDETDGTVRINGKVVPDAELIRFISPNPPLLKYAARAIRKCLKLDITSDMYADNPRALGYFTPKDGSDPEDEEVQEFLDAWKVARRLNADAYVGSALEYHEAGKGWSPRDLELTDAQAQAVLQVSRATGLDPEDLGVSTTSRTYQNAVERRQDRVNDVLAPFMRAITDRLSMPDVTPRGRYVVFDLDDFLKADPLTRMQTYQLGITTGVTTVNEARKAEDRPDTRTTPAAPAPAAQESQMDRPVTATFERVAGLEFDTPQTSAAFSVDENARTITGLAVPWNQVASSSGRRWAFAKGSLRWKDAGRVKMLVDHDNSQPIGKAVKLTETEEGLLVTFKIARGPEGDKALQLAADGVRDGLSVGVDFQDDGVQSHPTDDSAYLITRAALREVTLTAMPAYDDARVTSVAAQREEGNAMHCTKCGQVHAPGVVECESTQTVTANTTPDLSAISSAITEGFSSMAQRVVVPAGGVGMGIVVNEPPVYRFDARGNILPGKFDFSTDVIAGAKGDVEAQRRALNFMGGYMGFDVDTTDGAALTPNKQRPDMYVDQREYVYPLWERVNRGTLTDNTPFVLPKFNTATGMVANHTEGVEPTPGAFTATSQTITPQAVSGKVEITRELWDRGGNPQLSAIIWRQMVRAYYEALEAYVVTVLDAASPTGITLTTAAADDALADEITAAWVALQYIRGGFAFDTFAVQIDLYKKLALAEDSTGRPLFPILGPMNTIGQSRARWGTIDVAGVEAFPAWALAATGTVAASSYLFDRFAVNFWASAPQRLQFEYRVAYVDLAIWGYKAGAITDLAGVREVIYDPA